MARQVFFDPFGSAVQGYNLGMQQEQNLQKNARDARQQDWQYNNVNPIQLSNMKLDNQFNQAVQPYRIQSAPYYLANTQADYLTRALPGAATYGLMSGDPSAMFRVLHGAYGYNFAPNGNGAYNVTGPDGSTHTFDGTDFIRNTPEAFQRAMGVNQGQIGLLNADANLAMAPMRAMYYYGRGAGDLYRGEGYLGREQAQYGNTPTGLGWGTGGNWATGNFNPQQPGGTSSAPASAAPYNMPPGMMLPQQ